MYITIYVGIYNLYICFKRSFMREIMSIVVPVFNREKWIEKMFLSVREQTYRPLRLILVDNGSTDSSLSVCHRLKSEYETDDFTVDVLQELKRGANAARNNGIL